MSGKGGDGAPDGPQHGFDVVWRDVHVRIGETHALKGVSGSVRAGKLLALMGPSGAGKTTLLNAIARRGPLSGGQVRYGGMRWSKALKRRLAFVEQEDVVYPSLTVRQSVTFMARLRLGLGPAETKARVDEMLGLLRLEKCADTIVGNALVRGISGGERKRMVIAQELLVDPRILLLDEPTSGLDSSLAMIVTDVLANLARTRNLAIIASIHQPSSQVFGSFTDLLLLHNGEVAYRGATATASAYFAAQLGLACPPEYNASDFFLDCCVHGRLDGEAARETLRRDFGAAGEGVDAMLARAGDAALEEVDFVARGEAGGKLVESTAERYMLPWAEQTMVLMEREWMLVRGDLFSTENILLYSGLSLLNGLLFLQLGFEEDDIFERFTGVFSLSIPWMFFPLLHSLTLLANEVPLRKELGVGAYRLSAWYIARTTVSLHDMHWPFLYVTVVFWMARIHTSFLAYVGAFALIVLSIVMYESMGHVIATGVKGPRVMTVTLLLMTFLFLFSGVFTRLRGVSRVLSYANPLLYAYTTLLKFIFEVDDPTYECADEGTAYPEPCGLGEDIRHDDIFEEYQLEEFISVGVGVAFMVAFTVVSKLLAFRLLRHRMREVAAHETPVGQPAKTPAEEQKEGAPPPTAGSPATVDAA